jgi:hypothetical protein
VRILIRLLSWVVIASAAITALTRGSLVYVFGPGLTRAFLWIAAGGTLCAVLTLARTRKRNRRPEPDQDHVVRRDRAEVR